MEARSRTTTGQRYLQIVLFILSMVIFYVAGGIGAVMIVLTPLIAIGAIYIDNDYKNRDEPKESVPSRVSIPWLGAKSRTLQQKTKPLVFNLNQLTKMDPYGFESFVARLFKAQGYAVFQTKETNDGGKDLVMKKDGTTFFVECKRYAKGNVVGRPLIQKLVGACYPAGAVPIFVTTSSFSRGAIKEAYRSQVVLIDGIQLVRDANRFLGGNENLE